MKPMQELIEDGIINENKIVTRAFIARFYKDQLIKFNKIGIGKETENGVKVTPNLIEITRDRLYQLQPIRKLKEKNEK